MASGTKNKGKGGDSRGAKGASALKAARAGVVNKKQLPWGTIIGVVVVLALAGAVFGYYLVKSAPKRDQESREDTAAAFAPSKTNKDPSKKIDGIVIKSYKGGGHVNAGERVAYDKEVPFGGPHDGIWAACTGVVYPEAVRTENMVHSLEHGAVWIAYNPDKLSDEQIALLELRVKNKPFTLMSPFPKLTKPISVQAWGHQLQVSDAGDQRIDNFIAALRQNQYNSPEPNGSCDELPGNFDKANPPPFDPSKPGKDAKPMDFDGNAGQMPGAGEQPPAGEEGAGEEQK